ncbi:MAG: DinB family protein [Dehalococcoidia bacterium]|nr:DinB family protein [Dehalococcoidia bacterium]
MASRFAIQDAMKESEARLARLGPLMETYAGSPLLDDGGKWTVKACLSHIAASGRVTAAAQRALDRASGKAPPPAPGGMSVDERNEQQVAERRGRSIAELAEETHRGHAQALEDLRGMDDSVLGKKVPGFGPNAPEQSVSGVIMRQIEYHEGGQMDRIEYAFKLHTRWV